MVCKIILNTEWISPPTAILLSVISKKLNAVQRWGVNARMKSWNLNSNSTSMVKGSISMQKETALTASHELQHQEWWCIRTRFLYLGQPWMYLTQITYQSQNSRMRTITKRSKHKGCSISDYQWRKSQVKNGKETRWHRSPNRNFPNAIP